MYQTQKTIEATSYILSRVEGDMPYIKLIKLLYLADREMVRVSKRTISGDEHWSLPYGPVLENTLRSIKDGEKQWDEFFETDSDARVISQKKAAEPSAISRADRQVLDGIIEKFGSMKWQDLVDYTHKELPEWEERTKGRSKINLYDIARAVGFSDAEAKAIVEADAERNDIQRFQEGIKSRNYA